MDEYDQEKRINQSEHQQIRFFIEGENLYLSFDLKDSKTKAMTQENQYIKTDSFSFGELIPDEKLAKDKAAKDALIYCT